MRKLFNAINKFNGSKLAKGFRLWFLFIVGLNIGYAIRESEEKENKVKVDLFDPNDCEDNENEALKRPIKRFN